MDEINVMITGIGGGGNGEQILKALKMSTIKYTTIGCDMNKYSKGLMEVDYPYIVPSASSDNYISTLLKICKKHQVNVLFYGSEPELKVISRNRSQFFDNGIFLPINPQNVIDICMDKNKTMDWFSNNGFNYPKSYRIINESDMKKIDFFPTVLKPSVGGGGSVNTFIAQTEKELKLFGNYLLEIYEEFIVQQYVGNTDSEYTVGVLCDMNGSFINSIAVKKNILSGLSSKIKIKNKTGNAKFGEILAVSSGISQGEIGRFPDVTEQCKNIALALGATGAINIQCRIENGKVFVFEINPRFSGTTSLRALVGYNEPDVLIRKHILNEDIKKDFEYKSGYIVRGLEEKLIDFDFLKNICEESCK